MKKIPCYQGESFSFFKSFFGSDSEANDTQFGNIPSDIIDSIKEAYVEYDAKFASDTLASIEKTTIFDSISKELKDLYKYSDPIIEALRRNILKRAKSKLCPYCTILSKTSTMDHIIPQTDFPQYAVHPKNIIPCCDICNRHKSNNWKSENHLLFLNPYIDNIPAERYLFVDIEIPEENTLIANFSLRNETNISDILFKRIKHHYTALKLIDSFREASTDIFADIKQQIHSGEYDDNTTIKKYLQNRSLNLFRIQGNNYWLGLLYEACSQNDAVINILKAPEDIQFP